MVVDLYNAEGVVSPSPTRNLYIKGTPYPTASPAKAVVGSAMVILLAYGASGGNQYNPAVLGLTAACAIVVAYLDYYARSYSIFTAQNAIDIDAYCNNTPSFLTRAYVSFMHRITSHAISREAAADSGTSEKFVEGLPLKADPSPHVPGLLVTSRLTDDMDPGTELPFWTGKPSYKDIPVIVGTIRMGFGHHRIAYSACSWATGDGGPTYFHDLLGIESTEAQMIRDADKLYSKGSRLASEIGGIVESLWGAATLSGNENSLRQSWQMAEGLIPLMMQMDKRVPVITSHSLVGMVAVACGFETVVNCVIDNHAQWFVVVPGALNLVQGPGNYFKLRKLGVPSQDVKVAGHWCPAELVDNIQEDCQARIDDLRNECLPDFQVQGSGNRRTFLLPIGGAGAQRKFVLSLVKAVIKSGLLDQGAQLVLNAGDHAHMKAAFLDLLSSPGAPAFDTLSTLEEVRDAASDRSVLKSMAPIVLCAFGDYFSAVATTDIMCRACDVLACKPSELAFYCIPKLMIRRVGDHEQFSAIRAYELGDGTREVRDVEETLGWMDLMLKPGSEVLEEMNRRVACNGAMGVYDGSKNAVAWAKQLAAKRNSH